MDSVLTIPSVLIRLLAMAWTILMVVRSRDWRLIFLPLMLLIMTVQPMIPHLSETDSLVVQVSVFTVLVVSMPSVVVRRKERWWGGSVVRWLLAVVTLYQTIALLSGDWVMTLGHSHLEFSVSLLLCLTVVLFGQIFGERRIAEQRLRDQALQDPLTGLPNRIYFMNGLKRAHGRARRRRHSFAVLSIGLDRFKTLNSRFGHTAGDTFLIRAARKLQEGIRPGDIAARLGGDQFGVFLKNIKSRAEADTIASRLKTKLAEPLRIEGEVVATTAGIGIAYSETGYQRPEDLLHDADTAMYRSKAMGKGYNELTDIRRHTHAISGLQLEEDLRGALERNEFVLLYQPIVELNSGRIAGCEALIRWRHPKRGVISPLEFIPTAEQTGLILPIGEWVLEEACRRKQAWHTAGLKGLRVCVNVSPRQLHAPNFLDVVGEALKKTKLPAKYLELEVTESVLMENPEAAAQVIEKLRSLGIRIAVDDFGTGYSSLSYLCRFAVHTLKIDRSFVVRLGDDRERTGQVIAALTGLGSGLGLDVIVEGVETESQLALLRSLGCPQAQGWLFSKPQPPDQLESWWRANGAAAQNGDRNVSSLSGLDANVREASRVDVSSPRAVETIGVRR